MMANPPSLVATWTDFADQCKKTFGKEINEPVTIEVLQTRLLKAVPNGEDGNKTADYFMRSLSCLQKASDIVIGVARLVSLQFALLVTLYLSTPVLSSSRDMW